MASSLVLLATSSSRPALAPPARARARRGISAAARTSCCSFDCGCPSRVASVSSRTRQLVDLARHTHSLRGARRGAALSNANIANSGNLQSRGMMATGANGGAMRTISRQTWRNGRVRVSFPNLNNFPPTSSAAGGRYLSSMQSGEKYMAAESSVFATAEDSTSAAAASVAEDSSCSGSGNANESRGIPQSIIEEQRDAVQVGSHPPPPSTISPLESVPATEAALSVSTPTAGSSTICPNEDAKVSMLRTITDTAEHDLRRILAASDELFHEQQEEEEERKRREEERENAPGSRKLIHGTKRRKRRRSLRDRVEHETRRRREEHSRTGMAERRMRLERRRRYWEMQKKEHGQDEAGGEGSGSHGKRSRKGGANVEGLGLPSSASLSSSSSSSAFIDQGRDAFGSDTDATWSSDTADADSSNELLSLLDGDGIGDAKASSSAAVDAETSPLGDQADRTFHGDESIGLDDADSASSSAFTAHSASENTTSPAPPATSTASAPSLMDLLDDTPAQQKQDDARLVFATTDDAMAEPQPSTRAPTLMEALDDSKKITASNDRTSGIDEEAAKAPTLMELLDDDSKFNNEKPKTRSENNDSSPSGMNTEQPSSLMDLLNENFRVPKTEDGPVNVGGGIDADSGAKEQQQGSLMVLLDENFPTGESSAIHQIESGPSFLFEAKPTGDNLSDSLYAKQSSLMDLLDENIDGNTSTSTSSTSSLLDLLDDDGAKETMSAKASTSDDSTDGSDEVSEGGGTSLLDLLHKEEVSDDTEFNADVHLSDPQEDYDSGSNSLLDLLDDAPSRDLSSDRYDDPVSSSTFSASGQANDLLSLLDDADDANAVVTTSFDDSESYLSFADGGAEYGASFGNDKDNTTAIVDELLALLISTSRSEWKSINGEKGNDDITSEAAGEAPQSDSEHDGGNEDKVDNISTMAEDLLRGLQQAQWMLNADELNLILLRLATLETKLGLMELLVKIFRYMEDCRSEGHISAAPNAATYSILMTAFGKRGHDFLAAAFVCERMMEAMEANVALDGDEDEDAMFYVDEDAVDIGMRALKKCDNLKGAERLLSLALGEAGVGVDVRMSVYTNMLLLYKEDNLKEEALKLLDVCIRENGGGCANSRRLDRFVKALIRWPRTNRTGNKIATALHNQMILEYLEEQCADDADDIMDEYNDEKYRPSWAVWRELLSALSRNARNETTDHFQLVRRAFQGLVNASADRSHPDHFVLKLGLEAAEALGDANLAADLMEWSWQSAQQFLDVPSSSLPSFAHRTDGQGSDDLDTEFDMLLGAGIEDAGNGGKELSIAGPPSVSLADKNDEVASGTTDAKGGSDLLSLLDSDPKDVNETEQNGHEHEVIVGDDGIVWSKSEHQEGPPRHFIHIPVKAYYQAIKICLAQGNAELAHAILNTGCSLKGEIDSRLPESSRSHLYTLVMAGYAQNGDIETAESLLTEMQNDGPRPTEHTYAAFIHSLAMANHADEASEVLDGMICDKYGDGVKPQSSCFSACMLSALKAKDYERVLDLNTKMMDSGIKPDSQSYFGVVLASTRLGDRGSALKAAESALESKLPINHDGFDLMCKALLPNSFGDGSIPSMRKSIRKLGSDNSHLTVEANKLIRSLRMVEVEEKRPERIKDARKCENLWRECLDDLCKLVHKVDKL